MPQKRKKCRFRWRFSIILANLARINKKLHIFAPMPCITVGYTYLKKRCCRTPLFLYLCIRLVDGRLAVSKGRIFMFVRPFFSCKKNSARQDRAEPKTKNHEKTVLFDEVHPIGHAYTSSPLSFVVDAAVDLPGGFWRVVAHFTQ